MKRTQLYLQDDLWKALHIESRQNGVSISELVRRAITEKYASSPAERKKAMTAFVGLWKNRSDLPDSETYVRRLRKGKRLARISR
jgi:hypothetical protein